MLRGGVGVGCCYACREMVVAQPGHWMLDAEGHIPVHMLAQFEHASMSLFFLLYALVALATEGGAGAWRPLPFGFLHVLAACALGQEYLLFTFHSGDHMGVEGQYHTLLCIPIGLSLLAGLLELAFPRAFLLPLVRAAGFMLQGLLLVQTAFSVWVPSMIALHCTHTPDRGLWCEGEQWVHRAKALANLQFAWWCAALIVVTVLLFVFLRHTCGKEDYMPLALGEDLEKGAPGPGLSQPPHPMHLVCAAQAQGKGEAGMPEAPAPGQGGDGQQ